MDCRRSGVVGSRLRWLSPWKAPGSKTKQPSAYEVVTQLIKEGEQAQDAQDWAVAVARYREALTRYAQAFRAGGGWLSVRQVAEIAARLGHCSHEEGDFEGAEDAFRHAIGLNDRFDHGHYFLGLLLQRSARQPEAAAVFFGGLQKTQSPLL